MIENLAAPRQRLIGDQGLWIMVAGDLVVFGLFFVTFAYYHAENAETFRQAARALGSLNGLGMTLLLLTGSALAAQALADARGGKETAAARGIMLCTLCGLLFVLAKIAEWASLISAGVGINANIFFTLYFMFGGIHLLHLGVAIASMIWVKTRIASLGVSATIMEIESVSIFWHLIDIIWIVLFALFYLLD